MAAPRVAQEDVEQVQCLIEALPAGLSTKQRVQEVQFICNNAGVFFKGEFDIGWTHLVEHSAETLDNRPMRQALRRHPVAYLPLIDDYVQEMQDNGIIEPRMGSEWVSNAVLVRKKDRALHYCIDYRGLNEVTTKANYLLPHTDACHDSFGGNI